MSVIINVLSWKNISHWILFELHADKNNLSRGSEWNQSVDSIKKYDSIHYLKLLPQLFCLIGSVGKKLLVYVNQIFFSSRT